MLNDVEIPVVRKDVGRRGHTTPLQRRSSVAGAIATVAGHGAGDVSSVFFGRGDHVNHGQPARKVNVIVYFSPVPDTEGNATAVETAGLNRIHVGSSASAIVESHFGGRAAVYPHHGVFGGQGTDGVGRKPGHVAVKIADLLLNLSTVTRNHLHRLVSGYVVKEAQVKQYPAILGHGPYPHSVRLNGGRHLVSRQ